MKHDDDDDKDLVASLEKKVYKRKILIINFYNF